MLLRALLSPLIYPARKLMEIGEAFIRWLSRLGDGHRSRLRADVVYAGLITAIVSLMLGHASLAEAIGSLIAVLLGAVIADTPHYPSSRNSSVWD
jgi:hypothetical protein